jgi:TolA-binding protein
MTSLIILVQEQQQRAPYPIDVNAIVLVISALCGGGAIGAVFSWLSNRGKNSAQESMIWTNASIVRLKALHGQIIDLQGEVKELSGNLEQVREVLEQERQIRGKAIALLAAHGIPWSD